MGLLPMSLYVVLQHILVRTPLVLTGYAQAHGRNAVSWEDKFAMDVWYTTHITLVEDVDKPRNLAKSVTVE